MLMIRHFNLNNKQRDSYCKNSITKSLDASCFISFIHYNNIYNAYNLI